MKRIAILVISAVNQPVYQHYLASYWSELIRHTNASVDHIDVFLLKEREQPAVLYRSVADNVIEDPRDRFDDVLPAHHHQLGIPTVLSKTLHALEVLAGDYDVFFRTNLSSIVMLPALDHYVQTHDDLCYSGAVVWSDALRENITVHGLVGPDRAVRSLSELDEWTGNTFVSGAGFLLNADEATHLVSLRSRAVWSLPDDVAIGLMLDRHRVLDGFGHLIVPETPIASMAEAVESTKAAHIRLQRFPIERARALWRYLERSRPWE